jgi:hypothetical protein
MSYWRLSLISLILAIDITSLVVIGMYISASAVVFFGAVILIVTGILVDYIWNLRRETNPDTEHLLAQYRQDPCASLDEC